MLAILGFDLIVATLLISLTEGPGSPFFLFLIFCIISAALNFDSRGTIATGAVAAISYLVITLFHRDDPISVNRLMIRIGYLAAASFLLAHIAGYQDRLRRELLAIAKWPRQTGEDVAELVQALLARARDLVRARRIVMTWEANEEPWRHIATLEDKTFAVDREAPSLQMTAIVRGELAETAFHCEPDLNGSLLYLDPKKKPRIAWRECPIDPEFREKHRLSGVIAAPFRDSLVQGNLFFAETEGRVIDDLVIAEIVSSFVLASLTHHYASERLRQTAAVNAKISVARDLHDGVLQSLAGAVLTIEAIRHSGVGTTLTRRLEQVQQMIGVSQRELRDFITQLRRDAPMFDAAEDLLERLKRLGERIAEQWNIAVEMTVDPVQLPAEDGVAQQVYNIVSEALTNAARHSSASRVSVNVSEVAGRMQILVTDDGRGFPFVGRYDLPTLLKSQRGPVTLKERVVELGGDMLLESTPGGSRVHVSFARVAAGRDHS